MKLTIKKQAADPLNLTVSSAPYIVFIDGSPINLKFFRTSYVAKPTEAKTVSAGIGIIYQQMNIYIPENATKHSAIILIVGNGGWMPTAVPSATIVNSNDYSSATSNIGAALKAGYIVVSIGTRSRGLVDVYSEEYIGHSPSVVTDTKAAIRYLRLNADNLTAGNTDRIVITGTSGGGALSSVIAASGNSPDYLPFLYEIGAAGVEWIGTDEYTSASVEEKENAANYKSIIRDDVFAPIAYCPIIELPIADMAYEWGYNAARSNLPDNAWINGNNAPFENNSIMRASSLLAAGFSAYMDVLCLKDEYGDKLTATWIPPAEGSLSGVAGGSYKDAIKRLLEKSIQKAILGVATGSASVDGFYGDEAVTGIAGEKLTPWLAINGVPFGNTCTNPAPGDLPEIYDMDAYMTYVGTQSMLKTAPSFDNLGTTNAGPQNENNLWGAKDQAYSHVNIWSWENDTGAITGVGMSNTGKGFSEYLQSEEGKFLALQMKMSTPIPYLVGKDKIPYLKGIDSSDICDIAPYWYVRHGMRDISSHAVESLLYFALLHHESVKGLNFYFAWMKPHGGNYDVAEAYQWLAEIIESADNEAARTDVEASTEKLPGT